MKQKEILLCKYGEIVLKGANRKYFEDMLSRQMKNVMLIFVIVGEKNLPNLAAGVGVGS